MGFERFCGYPQDGEDDSDIDATVKNKREDRVHLESISLPCMLFGNRDPGAQMAKHIMVCVVVIVDNLCPVTAPPFQLFAGHERLSWPLGNRNEKSSYNRSRDKSELTCSLQIDNPYPRPSPNPQVTHGY